MIASVHVADVGAGSALAALRSTPKPASTRGLRQAFVALGAPLSGSVRPAPTLGRAGVVAFWDDDDALDRFLSDHPMAARLSGGWNVRLAPVRAWGTWPGLPTDLPTARVIDQNGPAAVLTLGRLRPTQALRFFRTSAKAEAAVLDADGLTWATGFGRPPIFSTFSLWETPQALSAYAYGQSNRAHLDAIAADRAEPFHRESAFIRFRPYDSTGRLEGSNPLPEAWMSTP